MIDCREVPNIKKTGPLSTCRFDTRIDYMFVSESWFQKWELKMLDTIEDSASDHNMVIAVFKKKDI